MSNLYARRLFSEHPIAMWSFDDKVTFIDQLSAAERDMTSWTAGANTSIAAYGGADISGTPFPSERSYVVSPTVEPVASGNISVVSPSVWSAGTTKADVPVSISAFVYVEANSVDYVEFGSTDGVSYDTTVNYFPEIAQDVWVKIHHDDMQYEQVFLNFVYKDPALGYSGSNYGYIVNGLSVGQYSEPVAHDSVGVIPQSVPPELSSILPDVDAQVVLESSFGVDARSGYHVVRDNELLSYNAAMPIVYGSQYLTRLRPAPSDHPSFIFDGCGMFTEQGRYDTYTLEFWIRISGTATAPRRILGPAVAGNKDGLFIFGSTMTLSIGDKFVSYNVGRLGDPMLIHLVYAGSALTLMINGEAVAEIPVDAKSIDLPDETNQYLGFYSYDDLGSMEIDVVSVFGYAVPGAVAKRRFVWGQGVGDISLLNAQYRGDGVYASFASADYTNSVSYPDNAKWSSGNANALDISRNRLGKKDVVEPVTVLSGREKSEWFSDLNAMNVSKDDDSDTVNKLVYFNYCPTIGYVGQQNYTLFNSILRMCKDVDGLSIAAEFASMTQDSSDIDAVEAFLNSIGPSVRDDVVDGVTTWAGVTAIYPMLRINSRTDPREFLVLYAIVDDPVVTIRLCYFNKSDESVTVLGEHTLTDTTYVGIIRLSGYSSANLDAILSRLYDVEVVLGSDQVVSGNVNIHSFSLFDKRFYNQKIASHALANPLLDPDYGALPLFSSLEYDSAVNSEALAIKDLLFTTYTYLPKQEFGNFYEDIGVRGSWEDYVPLSALAGVVQDFEGKEAIAVDSIQLNLSYPAPHSTIYTSVPENWTYDDLNAYYANMELGFLYLGLFTGYSTYDKLKTRSSGWDFSEYTTLLDTSKQMVRSWVAIQDSSTGLKQLSDYSSTVAPVQANTVFFSAFSDYTDTLFEVVDGAILVPPRNKEATKLTMLVGLEYAVPGVKTFPVEIKSLELASFAKNRNQFTRIKSLSGKDITPFVYNGIYYDHSAHNPFRIDKHSLPYLYLGKDSGITPLGPHQDGWKKGMQIAVSQSKDTNYKLDSVQFWIRRGIEFSPQETLFMEFKWGNYRLDFKVKAFQDDGTRGIISVYDKQGVPYLNGTFFQNGNIVANPVVEIDQWNAIQFSFDGSGLEMFGSVGYINAYPGFSYNNLSYFAAKQSLGSTQIDYRSWAEATGSTWNDFYLQNDWQSVLIAGTATLKAKELSKIIYDTYVGTSSIEIEGQQPIRFQQDAITTYSGSSWSSTAIIPV